MINKIKSLLEEIEKLTDEFASWNEGRDYDNIINSAEEVTDKTSDMLDELKNEKKNNGLLYKLLGKDWSSKLSGYTSKRSLIFNKYDYLITQLSEAEEGYSIYLAELKKLIDRLDELILTVKEESDLEYTNKYIKNILLSFKNSLTTENIKLEAFKSLKDYMENNKVTFKAAFSSIVSQIEGQKFLNAVNSFNSTAYNAVNDIAKLQSAAAVDTLKLIANIKENASILSYDKLVEAGRVIDEGKKLLLNQKN